MSYGKFLDDWTKHARWRHENNLPKQTMDEDLADVRDKWIAERRYKELIAFILENWDSGNCDDFCRSFCNHLIENRELTLYKRLWKGIIRNRLEKLWRDVDDQKKNYPNITLNRIITTDISNYNQFSSNETLARTLAWRRLYIINGINEFITGLEKLNDKDQVRRLMKMFLIILNLKKPKPKPTTDKRKIDESVFWQLIDEARQKSVDQINFIDNLRSNLETFDPKELRNFNKILLTKTNG